ncbi:hypothetical protein GQ53DRAFT_767715 [Thozetella sp. PMI_491]|nr:hypothetical protein GQ53DRAFT_767715 [Thozetella sp. PMI_491]
MSGIDSAAEVAEDYQHALEDLTMNSRIEIGNLTSVAKDSLQHAHAIAEVLQNHIKKAPPNRTLPALYVLDSIVKNVGTPYTLYFGKNLFSIFMGAYTKVDNMTRRKMDEMLKTWKEPVPGSMTKLPVFPLETTRPIENALIGARNAALAANQSSFQTQQQLLSRGRQPPIQRDTPTPPNVRPGAYTQPPSGPNGIHADPNGAQHAYPMHQNAPTQYPGPSTPQPAPPLAGAPAHYPQPPAYGVPAGTSVDNIKQDLQQLIVMARVESAQSPHDIRIQTKLKALLDLQTFLQSQNLSQDQLMLVKTKVAELTNTRGGLVRAPLSTVSSNAEFRPASLKIWNPNLVSQLYDSLGPPCTQCGRRFTVDEKGRAQKTAHMDWHFRVNQRIAEAEKKGQHRSFYVDEMDWIRSREAIDTDYVAVQPDRSSTGGATVKASKMQYIAVPDDPRINTMCPICQEKFEMKWLDEAQEWVWMDTVKVGDRVYHASCHREATRDGGGVRGTPEPVLGKRKAEDDFKPYRPKVKMEGY